jgi:hypothetical protein
VSMEGELELDPNDPAVKDAKVVALEMVRTMARRDEDAIEQFWRDHPLPPGDGP